MSSPSFPSPRDNPKNSLLLIYVTDADIPSIFGSAEYSISNFFLNLNNLIFFSKFEFPHQMH